MTIEQLWQNYQGQLRQFLLTRVDNPADVEDLLQDILIKSYQRFETVKQPSKVQSWLFQIARNTLIDYYRKSRVNRVDVDMARLISVAEVVEDYEQTRQELAQCIRPLMAQLPDKYREAVDLVDLQGKSQKVLASEWGLSHSAVKSRVQRGRRMLNSLFHACCRYQLDTRGNPIAVEVTGGCQNGSSDDERV
ncbi:RNA polymerase sigma factor SigZ [Acaryochloris sp. IP29b_bin.137]|uniref:RNA polymerase sigma factor SigZ n=1 Tax=Acaryochloris sp. IP29b_bin.137 TaxID=2969217 RepID=UPI0026106702|nr:RNA polymerase sigma factor SigZ [Acaryochloris sp. IP29b_bin.137]